MFAEKSSSSDWMKRGEDFMKHALYSVAAKCFGMGGDLNRQKVAIAHGQALQVITIFFYQLENSNFPSKIIRKI